MKLPAKKLISRLWQGARPAAERGGAAPRALVRDYNLSRPLGPQPMICWAPFRNIYFTAGGEAVACCNNRSYIFGRWPEQSIHEIWFGQKAEFLRKRIRKNDLGLGCVNCRDHLRVRNFDAIKAMMYDHIPANENRYPGVMELELSSRCNLACIMCRGEFSSTIRKKREGKPPLKSPYDERFIRELAEFIPHLSEIKFYGGEPFLVDLYYGIWDMILSVRPELGIVIQTNATVMNERVRDYLARGRFHVTASLEAVEKECYEGIRVGADFDRVMENIREFAAYAREKGTYFGISACAMRQNWRQLPGILSLCNSLDVPVYFHTVWHPPQCSLWNLPSAELSRMASRLSQEDWPGASAAQAKNRRHYEDLVGQLKAWQKDAQARESKENEYEGLAPDSLDYLFRKMEITLARDLSCGQKEAGRRLARMVRDVTAAVQGLPRDYPLALALAKVNQVNGPLLASILEQAGSRGIRERFLLLGDELGADPD